MYIFLGEIISKCKCDVEENHVGVLTIASCSEGDRRLGNTEQRPQLHEHDTSEDQFIQTASRASVPNVDFAVIT